MENTNPTCGTDTKPAAKQMQVFNTDFALKLVALVAIHMYVVIYTAVFLA